MGGLATYDYRLSMLITQILAKKDKAIEARPENSTKRIDEPLRLIYQYWAYNARLAGQTSIGYTSSARKQAVPGGTPYANKAMIMPLFAQLKHYGKLRLSQIRLHHDQNDQDHPLRQNELLRPS